MGRKIESPSLHIFIYFSTETNHGGSGVAIFANSWRIFKAGANVDRQIEMPPM